MAPFCPPPPCAPQCELVSPSVTLAPRGELVIHLSRSHRVASSFSSIFIFFLDRGRFCPFSLKLSFSLCDHSRTAKRDQKTVVSMSIIVVSPSRFVVVVVFEVVVVVVSVAGSLCSLLKLLVRKTRTGAVTGSSISITWTALWSRLTILGYSAPGTLRSALQRRKLQVRTLVPTVSTVKLSSSKRNIQSD